MKNEMAKNERSYLAIQVFRGLFSVAALVCIIISMAADRASPYLTMGFGLSSIGFWLGMLTDRRKKGNKDGFSKDGSIS